MNLFIVTNSYHFVSLKQQVEAYSDTSQTNGIDCEVVQLPDGALARRRLFKKAVYCYTVFHHSKILNLSIALWLQRYSRKMIYNYD